MSKAMMIAEVFVEVLLKSVILAITLVMAIIRRMTHIENHLLVRDLIVLTIISLNTLNIPHI